MEPTPFPTLLDPLRPGQTEFQQVSSALAKVRVIGSAFWLLLPAVGFSVGAVMAERWLWLPAAGLALCFLWTLWLIPRQVRAIGYATDKENFLVRKGVLFRHLVVVPYGRIQYVDIKEGPLARKLGLASIQLHTASAQTDTSLAGLPSAEAIQLRELLLANGNAELSGL